MKYVIEYVICSAYICIKNISGDCGEEMKKKVTAIVEKIQG